MECQPACPVMKLSPTPQVCTPRDPQNHSHLSTIQHALKEGWVSAQEEQTQYQNQLTPIPLRGVLQPLTVTA